ncbi:MAG: ABC transporter permease [Acidimicrobiia bacterium]
MCALRGGFWLGWKIESNWTDPLLFLIYTVARPIGASLILVAMFYAVSGGERGPLLDFLVVGTAAWPLVLAGLHGLAGTVVEDREHYRMTRSVYTSPIPWPAYLIGRALAMTTSVGAGGAVVTIGVGALALGVDLDLSAGGLAFAAGATVLGLIGVFAVGLLAVSYALRATGDAWQLPDALAAALYLVCGAIFPVPVLPGALEAISRAVPITWWLEALRRALLGADARVSFPALSDGEVLAWGALTSFLAAAVAAAAFRHAVRRSRQLGILDRETGY